MILEPYVKVPLRISVRPALSDPKGPFDLAGSVQCIALVFRRTSAENFECMGCAECGNEWIGCDWKSHAEAHQMGLDYALYTRRRVEEKTA